jgi:hypothetical protein
MTVNLTGYFKFSNLKNERAKIRDGSASEALLKSACGLESFVTRGTVRDAWNAIISKCARLGWYRNGGWMPNGRHSLPCRLKEMGDILGVCASFGQQRTPNAGWGHARVWLYCDKDFEKAMLEDFFPPETRLRLAVNYFNSVTGLVLYMDSIPDHRWLNAFCKKTHDPKGFARRVYGRTFTKEEALAEAKRLPKLAKYIKTMLMEKEEA